LIFYGGNQSSDAGLLLREAERRLGVCQRIAEAMPDHLDLLIAVRHGDRIELASRAIPAQNAARILPGDGGAGLDLRPGNLGIVAAAVAPLGDEVINPCRSCRRGTSSAPSST
jgi:hypothetical protein